MVSGAKVLKVIKETRLSGSCVTFRLRAPTFLPEETECACAVFSGNQLRDLHCRDVLNPPCWIHKETLVTGL